MEVKRTVKPQSKYSETDLAHWQMCSTVPNPEQCDVTVLALANMLTLRRSAPKKPRGARKAR
eukprot:994254-Alexandrium_andersonii.AAC.1